MNLNKKYKQGEVIEKMNKRTGFPEREIFKVISSFAEEKYYSEFLLRIYTKKFSLFSDYVQITNNFMKQADCFLSNVQKEKTTSIINTIIAMYQLRDKHSRAFFENANWYMSETEEPFDKI